MPVIIMIGLSSFGVSQARLRLDDISPTIYALATRADQRAANWIFDNSRSDDRILVNSFFVYGGSMIAGSDGGWWLPLMTKRMSTQPPLNYGSEEGLEPDYARKVNELIATIEQKGLTDPRCSKYA